MSQEILTDATPTLRPIASSERIQALDVVRGFALIGIFLMNIEWFNRPIAELGMGLPSTLQGADWWAGYLIYILVQGKFWTMFSLLFGMGFAVMLTRAERAGRGFLVPYMRRIAALAVFGACHHIFLWAGDILFSYAVAAMCLLLLLWARWWALVLIPVVAFVIAGVVPGAQMVGAVGFGMTMVLLGAWFLRAEARVGDGSFLQFLGWVAFVLTLGNVRPEFAPSDEEVLRKRSERAATVPWHAVFFWILGGIALGIALIAGASPNLPPGEARWPALIAAFFLLLVGTLSWRFKDPVAPRPRRLGGTMYMVPFMVMLAFGLLQVYGPERPKASEAQVEAALVVAKAERAAKEAGTPAPKADAKKAEKKKSPTEEAAMREAQRRLGQAEHDEEVVTERRLQTTGSYSDFVRFRAKEFGEHVTGEFGFATVLIGMFMLGYWFVRTGVMEHPDQHLPLFRKLAMVGLPLGVGLGIIGSLISMQQLPGVDRDPYQTAVALLMIGNLPACLGYVSLLVLMLHSRGPFAKVSVLAPLGRMALTNYLTHSLLCSLYFYGYAGGHYGMHRATQVGFVFGVIALQVVFCTWWLSKFRYGPMEWLWRAITYWQLPAFRREPVAALAGNAAA